MSQGTRGDTRWTAILSLDMVGFSELSVRMDNEQLYALLGRVLGLARAAIEAQGGHVVDTAGDGILAAFGAPVALEAPSVRCCRAAQTFRDRLTAEAAGLAEEFGVVPQFRAGIAGGATMVAHPDEDTVKIVGAPVILASRLQDMAAPDEILLSAAVLRDAEGYITVESRGAQPIKGFETAEALYALTGATLEDLRFSGLVRRGLTSFVSRDREVRTLAAALTRGHHLMLVSGPAGIGKSRLVHEACATLPPDIPVLMGQCAFGQEAAPFAPVLSMLRQSAGLEGNAGRDASVSALLARYPDLCDQAAAAAFAAPLSQEEDPTGRALRDRAFLAELLARLQQRTGSVLVLEDAHWADRATRDFLAGLAERDLSLIVTARPEYRPGWADKDTRRLMALTPLDTDQAARIAQDVLNGPLAPALRQRIAEKSEGLPLMAEELARALQSGGHVRRTEEGIDLANPGASLLTGTLEQLVLSRIDPLPETLRDILTCAAAVGRDFHEDIIAGAGFAAGGLAEIDSRATGLLEQTGPRQWRFAHALIRDAVYASLLQSQRRDLHRRIAAAFEAQETKTGETVAILADHFERAGQPDKAAEYLVQEAGNALDAYALDHADATATRAFDLMGGDLTGLPGEVQDTLAITWLRVLDQIGNFAKQARVGPAMLTQLETRPPRPALCLARALIALGTTHRRKYRDAERLAQQTLQEAEEIGDDWGMAFACLALMRVYEETNWQPRAVIEELGARIAPVAEARRDRHLAMTALYQLSAIYRSTGNRQRAIDVSQELSRFAETHNNLRARGYAAWTRALVHATEGDPIRVRDAVGDYDKYTIPGSADHMVMKLVEAYVSIFLDDLEVTAERIRAARDWGDAMGDMNAVQVAQWCEALFVARSGRIGQGWHLINTLVEDTTRGGCIPLVRQSLVLRSEVALAVLGLVDPARDMQGRAPPPQRNRPGLRDVLRFAQLRIFGAKQAQADLTRLLELDPERHGGIYALANVGLGLLAMRRRDVTAARSYFDTGLAAANEEGFEIPAGRARRALASLAPMTGEPNAADTP